MEDGWHDAVGPALAEGGWRCKEAAIGGGWSSWYPHGPVPRVIVHRLSGSKKALDACRLVEGLYLAGRRVVVWLADERKAKMFNDYLWTFADESFVPHVLSADTGAVEEPVVVTTGELGRGKGAHSLVLLDPPEHLEPLALFEDVHDFVTTAPGDAGRVDAWRNAGFEVTQVRGGTNTGLGGP